MSSSKCPDWPLIHKKSLTKTICSAGVCFLTVWAKTGQCPGIAFNNPMMKSLKRTTKTPWIGLNVNIYSVLFCWDQAKNQQHQPVNCVCRRAEAFIWKKTELLTWIQDSHNQTNRVRCVIKSTLLTAILAFKKGIQCIHQPHTYPVNNSTGIWQNKNVETGI